MRKRIERYTSKGFPGILTGFSRFDEKTGGLRGITVLGGPPKVNKSTFALNIALNVSETGIPVLYYDLENGEGVLQERVFCRYGQIDPEEIQRGRLTLDHKECQAVEYEKDVLLFPELLDTGFNGRKFEFLFVG